MGKTVIIFSTITGNAFRLAEAAASVLPEHAGPYNIRYVNDEVIDTFDTFVLAYWCDKGSADPDTIALLRRLHGKRIGGRTYALARQYRRKGNARSSRGESEKSSARRRNDGRNVQYF